jgi:hypothetical protein
MGMFKKNADPLSDRARELNAEIAALEAKIKDLDSRLHQTPAGPRLRSTARPQRPAPSTDSPSPREPVFEQVDHGRVTSPDRADEVPPARLDKQAGRKFEWAGVWRRIMRHFHGPPANNPKLVNYLAAGSIQGLRPMRYEKRVARNRVILLSAILFVVLWGIWAFLVRRH